MEKLGTNLIYQLPGGSPRKPVFLVEQPSLESCPSRHVSRLLCMIVQQPDKKLALPSR